MIRLVIIKDGKKINLSNQGHHQGWGKKIHQIKEQMKISLTTTT